METSVKRKFESYPEDVATLLLGVRALIFRVAKECGAGNVEEGLKWGEPSYAAVGGSPVRFDWKAKQPNHCCIYFNCKTTLVDTFRVLYGDLFAFEGNRALILQRFDGPPAKALAHCMSAALRYHKLKHLPLLGLDRDGFHRVSPER